MITHEIEKKNLVFRIIEYGLENRTFRVRNLSKDLKLNVGESSFVAKNLYCSNGEIHPNHLFASDDPYKTHLERGPGDKRHWDEYDCRLLPTAIFQYVDWLEIKEARKTSMESKRLALIAIAITLAFGVLQSLLTYLQLK